jgi:hypothetical protein
VAVDPCRTHGEKNASYDCSECKLVFRLQDQEAIRILAREAGRQQGVSEATTWLGRHDADLAYEMSCDLQPEIHRISATPPPQAAEPPACVRAATGCCPCHRCAAPPAVPAGEPPRVMSIDRHGDPVAVDPFLPPAVPAGEGPKSYANSGPGKCRPDCGVCKLLAKGRP